MNTVSIS